MNINVDGRNVEVTSALKDHVHKKINKLENKCKRITNVHVTLIVEKSSKPQQKAEAEVHLSASNPIFASAIETDMYASIDSLSKKLERQIISNSEKLKNHNHNHDGELI